MPYLYSAVKETCETGIPIIRALWLHYPGDAGAVARGAEYLYGRDILVAPVVEKGASLRRVYLPRGVWFDFWTEERVDGGRDIERRVDLETMPLYVRAGAVIPLDPIRQYTGEPIAAPLMLVVRADGTSQVRGRWDLVRAQARRLHVPRDAVARRRARAQVVARARFADDRITVAGHRRSRRRRSTHAVRALRRSGDREVVKIRSGGDLPVHRVAPVEQPVERNQRHVLPLPERAKDVGLVGRLDPAPARPAAETLESRSRAQAVSC